MRILDEDLGLTPEEETTALFEAIRTRRFPASDSATSGAKVKIASAGAAPPQMAQQVAEQMSVTSKQVIEHNLPHESTSFVGRSEEIVMIRDLLLSQQGCRLLTLIGPGGIGKTRLSLQVARSLVDDESELFRDGVYFVPLASITDSGSLVRTIASAVSCAFQGSGEPQDQLENFLRDKQLLLLIDNFEHLLNGADLLSTLLAHAQELSLLVTSRQALDLPEEWLHPLGGLAVPEEQGDVAEITANPSVQLFLQRARRADAAFIIDEDNQYHVVRICRLVNGMPLGLELSAAWVNTLTADEIASEIASNLDILASEMRNIPERHRSLRAVFEQTWQRLTVDEKSTLRRLSVFRGRFTREAAQQVADTSIMLLSSLVDKSLFRHQAGRYDVHELLRQFAFERLDDQERDAIQDKHSHYFCELLKAHQPDVMTEAEGAMLQNITDNFDNVLAAWRYLVESIQADRASDKSTHLIGTCVPVLSTYFERRGLFREGQQTLQQAISAYEKAGIDSRMGSLPVDDSLIQLQIEHAIIGMNVGEYHTAKEVLLALLSLIRKSQNKPRLAALLSYLGRANIRLAAYAEAEQCPVEALNLYQELDRTLESTTPLINMGVLRSRRQMYAEALEYYGRAVQIYTEVNYAPGIARCLSNMGSSYIGIGKIERATEHYRQAHKLAEENNDRLWVGITLSNLGSCAQELGDYPGSRERYEESLVTFRKLGEKRWIAVSLADLSFTLIALNDVKAAAVALREALSLALEYQLIGDGLQARAVQFWCRQT